MANPVNVAVPKNTWTLVAANVTDGVIDIKKYRYNDFYKTYVITGDPAPAGDQNIDTAMNVLGEEIIISAQSAIDVYLYSKDRDGEAVVSL